MCGIAGVYGANAFAKVKDMLTQLRHRGPDGYHHWEASPMLTLGHTRLAINDLSEQGRQPMISENQCVGITVNGEIYNYLELRSRLINEEGVVFQSTCDSEVVLHAYQNWGVDSFALFNGMFAIGIYDKIQDTLYLVRDRLGIKPLYYSHRDDELIFASEIKAITQVMPTKKAIDLISLKQYLTYSNTDNNRTLFQNIFNLSPGHYLSFRPGKPLEFKAYWEFSYTQQDCIVNFDEAVERYRTVFDQSISRHLLSDVEVATYLSAGFDSASVTARAAKIQCKPVSYTAYFLAGSSWYDETQVAEDIATQYASSHRKVLIQPEDLPRVLDSLVYALDEPKMGMSSFSQYVLAERVAKDHKVVLTGHGGDELFSGYPVFKLMTILDNIKKQPYKLGALMSRLKSTEVPHLAYFLLSLLRPRYFRHFLPVLHSHEMILKGVSSPWRSLLHDICVDQELHQMGSSAPTYGQQVYHNYLRMYLPGLLVVEDKISMAHGLESRTPFLDNEMLELSLKIPQQIKTHQNELKSIIKTAAKEWLPASVYTQPKRGFPTPLRYWFRRELRQWLIERLTGNQSGLYLLFDDKWLKRVCHQYLNSYKGKLRPLDEIPSHRIWQLLCLESWLRQFS